MRYSKRLAITTAIIFVSKLVGAQQVHQGFELLEMVKISENYREFPSLSFSVLYTYADSSMPSHHTESMTGLYKLQDGKFYFSMDSTEMIEDDQYSIAIFHTDSMITITPKEHQAPVLKLPLLDSLFQAANVDSMAVVQINDSTNVFKAIFKPDSYYVAYEMTYDNSKYLIKDLKYLIRDLVEDSVVTSPSGVAIIDMSFSGYSYSDISTDYFRRDKYVGRDPDHDNFFVKPGSTTSGYKLIVNQDK